MCESAASLRGPRWPGDYLRARPVNADNTDTRVRRDREQVTADRCDGPEHDGARREGDEPGRRPHGGTPTSTRYKNTD
jgi:hypothetical protein